MSMEYFNGFDQEPEAALPQVSAVPAEANRTPTTFLEQDAARLMPIVDKILVETLEPLENVDRNTFYINRPCNPLHPRFIQYEALKELGYGIHMVQEAYDSQGNRHPDSSMGLYVDKKDGDEFSDIMLFMDGFSEVHAPYAMLTTQIGIHPIFTGPFLEAMNPEMRKSEYYRVVPEAVDREGNWDEKAAHELYCRGFMTKVLMTHIDAIRDGKDPHEEAVQLDYIDRNWRIYEEMRRGEHAGKVLHALGFEELHGIVNSQIRYALEKTGITPPNSRQ